MISGKVDLTAHRDFSYGPGLVSFQHQIELMRIEQVLDLEDALFMSMDDYENLSKYHGIFGSRRHTNEKSRVFDYEGRHKRYWRDTCIRCGRPLRVPWNKRDELCCYCNDDMDYNYKRVPWKTWKENDQSGPRQNTNDVFNLR